MTELQKFCLAMDGEWEVLRYELLEDERLRVHYKSLTFDTMTWSHIPLGGMECIPKVGTRGRIGFIANKKEAAT